MVFCGEIDDFFVSTLNANEDTADNFLDYF